MYNVDPSLWSQTSTSDAHTRGSGDRGSAGQFRACRRTIQSVAPGLGRVKPRHEVTRWQGRSPVHRLDRSPNPPPPLLPAADGHEEGRRGTAVVVPPAARSGEPTLGSDEPVPGSIENSSSLPLVAPHRCDMGVGGDPQPPVVPQP